MARDRAPRTTAAVPRYVGSEFRSAPPGHRFRLYFDDWVDPRVARDGGRSHNRRDPPEPWSVNKGGKQNAIKRSLDLCDGGELLQALRDRRDLLARESGAVTLDYRTASPLVTGMGIDHPVENGFSFLDPYGLPYLPGSGAKGVVRRAAEELCLFEGANFTIADVWWLFGLDTNSGFFARAGRKSPATAEPELRAWRDAYRKQIESMDGPEPFGALLPAEEREKDWRRYLVETLPSKVEAKAQRNRGALVFWDVVPDFEKLQVEVMTPHFPKYYQGRAMPTDDQDPNPIPFLAIPAGASLSFHVEFAPPDGCKLEGWKEILRSAVDYAAQHLGFGGKTAAGYGRLDRDTEAASRREIKAQERLAEEARRAAEQKAEEERVKREQAAAQLKADLKERFGEAGTLIAEVVAGMEAGNADPANLAYQRLDEFDGEAKLKLAESLRDAYQRLGKWNRKQVSKKQKAKIDKIKGVLGE